MTPLIQFLRRTGLSANAPAWIMLTALIAVLLILLFSADFAFLFPMPFVLIAMLDPEGVVQGRPALSPRVTAMLGLTVSTLCGIGLGVSGFHMWPASPLLGGGTLLLGLILSVFSAIVGLLLLRKMKRGGALTVLFLLPFRTRPIARPSLPQPRAQQPTRSAG